MDPATLTFIIKELNITASYLGHRKTLKQNRMLNEFFIKQSNVKSNQHNAENRIINVPFNSTNKATLENRS